MCIAENSKNTPVRLYLLQFLVTENISDIAIILENNKATTCLTHDK